MLTSEKFKGEMGLITISTNLSNIECSFAILNFLAENGITEIEEKKLWDHVQYNIEPQAHKLWESTKTWENMDEVNNRLLSNEELGLRFFADIVCHMLQNCNEPNRNIIPDNKKEIFDDIHNLYDNQKDGYHYKFFKRIELLDGVDNINKVKIANYLLVMNPEMREKLLILMQKNTTINFDSIIESEFLPIGKKDKMLVKKMFLCDQKKDLSGISEFEVGKASGLLLSSKAAVELSGEGSYCPIDLDAE